MGLISFIKEAGSKLFNFSGSDPEEERREKIQALSNEVLKYGIEVTDLSINVDDETVSVAGEVASQADKERVSLVVGNVEGVSAVENNITVKVEEDCDPEPESRYYEVKRGDYLSKIAKEVYGDAMKYPVIFEANKPMLKDPDLIYPGQILRIPEL